MHLVLFSVRAYKMIKQKKKKKKKKKKRVQSYSMTRKVMQGLSFKSLH